MKTTDIKPEQTYWQHLKIVASGLSTNLFKAEMWDSDEIVDALGTLAWVVALFVSRLALLVTLPISAPLVTLWARWLVAKQREQVEAARSW